MLHYTFQFIQNQQSPCSSGGFFVLMYIFLNANQNFFSSLLFLLYRVFCVIAIFFLSSSKNMFELKEFPLYAGALQRESSFAHLSVSFIQFSLKTRRNPSRPFRFTQTPLATSYRFDSARFLRLHIQNRSCVSSRNVLYTHRYLIYSFKITILVSHGLSFCFSPSSS